MNSMLKVFAILFAASILLNLAMNYMADNISDFENVPLPPKKARTFETPYSLIKVDAKSRDNWSLVDFSTGTVHSIGDPVKEAKKLAELDWDLGFQRTKIISNGGETRPGGGVEVVNLGAVKFDAVRQIPAAGYIKDARGWGNVTNKSLVDWYVYRTRTHNIESKRNVYVVRVPDGYVKMRIINYYCDRPESECKSMMCTRDEAACLTIEYLHVTGEAVEFPVRTPGAGQTAQVTH